MTDERKNAHGVVLRDAKREDAESIQRMIVALADVTGDAHKITGKAEDLRRYGFGPDRLFDCLIAERGTESVGLCLYFFTYSSWLGEPGVYVQDLFVKDSERGAGTGRKLIAEVAKRAAARQATHLRLTVDSDNDSAKQFYSTLGMSWRDREDSYQLGGHAFAVLAETTL